MDYDFKLTAQPLTNVRITAYTDKAKQFFSEFGPIDEQNASVFIHSAKRSGFKVWHTQGDIPEGQSLIDWHDSWDGASRLSNEE